MEHGQGLGLASRRLHPPAGLLLSEVAVSQGQAGGGSAESGTVFPGEAESVGSEPAACRVQSPSRALPACGIGNLLHLSVLSFLVCKVQ